MPIYSLFILCTEFHVACMHTKFCPSRPYHRKVRSHLMKKQCLPFYCPKTENLTENIRYTGTIASVINSIEEVLHETPKVAEIVEEHPAI